VEFDVLLFKVHLESPLYFPPETKIGPPTCAQFYVHCHVESQNEVILQLMQETASDKYREDHPDVVVCSTHIIDMDAKLNQLPHSLHHIFLENRMEDVHIRSVKVNHPYLR